jgi:hypothetical protein
MTIIEPTKHKRGDVREDGMVFWGKIHKKPYWLTREKFQQYLSKEKEALKRNYEKKKSERLEKFKNYYSANKERHRELGRQWINLNPEKRTAVCKKYYQNNKEKVGLANKKWRDNNKEKAKAIWKRIAGQRREKIKDSIPLSKNQKKIVEFLYQQAQRLQSRLGIKFHVDHIVPIAKGGKHTPTNLQVIPASINVRKHAREIFIWSEPQLN